MGFRVYFFVFLWGVAVGIREGRLTEAEWYPTYGECSTGCGDGLIKLTSKICVKSGLMATGMRYAVAPQALPDSECALSPSPAESLPCSAVSECQYSLGAPPPSGCGWHEINCVNPKDGMTVVDMRHCKKANHLPQLDVWRSQHGLMDTSCPPQTLQSICTATVNYPAGLVMFSTSDKVKEADARVDAVFDGCDGADVVVIATQEFTTTSADIFKDFARGESLREGYVEVDRCGSRISAGVAVFVKEALHEYFAPSSGKCSYDTTGADNAFTNTKGTALFELFTVRGKLVAASTHGTRGGTISEGRVAMVHSAAKRIMEMAPTFVAWGGDFNQRTPISQKLEMELLKLGTTHPAPADLSEQKRDANKGWIGSFSPEAAHSLLASTPDILGSTDFKTLQQELDMAVGSGKLSEVPGVRDLCPTYRKNKVGKFHTSDSPLPGTGKYVFGQLVPGTAAFIEEWMGNWACKSPTASTSEPEYFSSPVDGKTKWPNRAPSWTERLIVGGLAVDGCNPPKKARPNGELVGHDHDPIYAVCNLAA